MSATKSKKRATQPEGGLAAFHAKVGYRRAHAAMSIMLLYPGARYGLDGDALVVVLADGTEIARLPPAEPPIVQPNISS